MLIVLEATTGPIAGRRIEVPAGSILRIGRTPKSDCVIGEDSYLSSQHFAVECDGVEGRVRDLGSSNGTFVNGDRVTSRTLREGDSLVAGGSTFSIHVDHTGAAPEPTPARSAVPGPLDKTAPLHLGRTGGAAAGYSRAQSALMSALYRDGGNVFAVLDSSRDSRIPTFLEASGERYAALDPAGAGSGRAAAYAAGLPRGTRLLDVLVKDGWGRGWGFYCATTASLEEVCRHWRAYLFLRTEDGRRVTFRFWDPRMLRATAPFMPPAEASAFFGPIQRLIVEGEKAELALELTPSADGCRQQTLVLL